ncbi:MAG: WecB/TagA/CpsF family glycosyltransferase, partial [Mariprofundales bacterium]
IYLWINHVLEVTYKNLNSKVLSSNIAPTTIEEVASLSISAAKKDLSSYICIANVHMVVTARVNEYLNSAMEAALLNTSDGMPLVWELKRQGYKEAERVSGPDLMIALCKRVQVEKLPVYFYGGSPEVVDSMRAKLTDNFPDLIIAGIESPPMLPEQPEVDPLVVEKIKNSGAKIVFVGLGCPKQELWMHAYSVHIPAVLIGVGAAFDFFAGSVKRAPLWMQKSGLEWFYRLCSEPRRLWRRYLVTNSLFILYWLKDRLKDLRR